MSTSFFSSAGEAFSQFGPKHDFASAMRWTHLSAPVLTHLKHTYLALALAVMTCGVGAYTNMHLQFNPLMSTIGMIGFMYLLAQSSSRNPHPSTLNKRLGYLGAFGFCQGMSMSGLLEVAFFIDSSIVPAAFFTTAIVFASFSAMALMGNKREYLYLGGTLLSVTSFMLVGSLVNAFLFRIPFLFEMKVYIGLLVFIGYVVFDTQMIVARREGGDLDFVRHALDLFVDVAAIFVRLVVIMIKQNEKKGRSRGGSGDRFGSSSSSSRYARR
jgi:FtsH-binding integral membrane protein